MLYQMRAEFLAACVEIETRARQVEQEQMAEAWAALVAGDIKKRDRIIEKLKGIGDVTIRAKTEAGVRIGEKYGLDRDEVETAVRELLARQ